MSLKYGLNVKKAAPAPTRKTILDEEDDEDEQPSNAAVPEAPIEEISSFGNRHSNKKAGLTSRPPPNRLKKDVESREDLSSASASRAQVKAAEEVDPSIFDYDSFHDAKAAVSEAKKAEARKDAIERKPKYINNLLDAASKRKQDQLIAREKLLQKERENEGEEFADKEKFVTGAYKEQQEEARRLEEEEKTKAEAEEKRKREGGGGMQVFYRGMMDEQEKQHQEAMDAAKKMKEAGVDDKAENGEKRKTEADLVAELKAQGKNIHVNEEGQITDKRELLSAGLNITPSGNNKDSRGADHLKASVRPTHSAFQRNDSGKQAQRERQSRMMEEQLAAQAKRAREEEEEERKKVESQAKSAKTEKDVNDAKARYLARKAAKERGEG